VSASESVGQSCRHAPNIDDFAKHNTMTRAPGCYRYNKVSPNETKLHWPATCRICNAVECYRRRQMPKSKIILAPYTGMCSRASNNTRLRLEKHFIKKYSKLSKQHICMVLKHAFESKSLPSRSASPHFGQYLFPVPQRVGG